MQDMSIVDERELEEQAFSSGGKFNERKPTGDDPIADWLLKTYHYLNKDNFKTAKICLVAIPIIALTLFAFLISN